MCKESRQVDRWSVTPCFPVHVNSYSIVREGQVISKDLEKPSICTVNKSFSPESKNAKYDVLW